MDIEQSRDLLEVQFFSQDDSILVEAEPIAPLASGGVWLARVEVDDHRSQWRDRSGFSPDSRSEVALNLVTLASGEPSGAH